jgi:ABC-2 type transport system permease protein
MKKLLVIAWKEIISRFTDPIVLLLTIAMPLAIAALIHLAFGGVVLGEGIPDTNIPVGIVNQDTGGQWGNFGEIFVRAMLSDAEASVFPSDSPFELFTVREIEDERQARHLVEREELIAVLFIPPDFSEALAAENATIEVYINDRYGFRGVAFKSVVETLANIISTCEATVHATVKVLARNPRTRAQLESGGLNEAMTDLALTAAMPESNPIQIRLLNNPGQSAQVELTRYLAATLAITFTSFTALMGSASLWQEKAQWTLQRMVITPTWPGIILGGKAVGTYLNGLIQMGMLVGGMAAVERLLSRGPSQGTLDPLGLLVLILAVVAAATGVGVAIAGIARTYTQAANYGRAILLLMGLVGGIFFPIELFPRSFDVLSGVTFHHWAMDGYLKLALGGGVISILPHILILAAMGLLSFTIGSWFVRRRIWFF